MFTLWEVSVAQMLPKVSLGRIVAGHCSFLDALKRHGFCFVSDCDGIGNALDVARRVLDDEGTRNARGKGPRGYYEYKGTQQQSGRERIDAFQWGRAEGVEAARQAYFGDEKVPRSAIHENVRLPNEELNVAMEGLYNSFSQLSRTLFEILAREDPKSFRSISHTHSEHDSTLELKRYVCGDAPAGSILLNPHRDQSMLTLLVQSMESRCVLQVANTKDDWIDAVNQDPSTTILVNVGDFLERLSVGGHLRSTMHRVIVKEDMKKILHDPRYSVAFFASPSWDFDLGNGDQIGDVLPFF